jgi:subtilisin family serine protease
MDPDERDGSGIDPELMRRAKVSPHLRAAAAEWERSSKEAQSAEGERAVAPVAPEVRVLIELARPDTSELQKSGLAFEHLFGLFYVAKVSLDRLDDLARLDSILRIHHEQGTAPTLDDSIPDIRASTVRNPQYPFSGTDKYTGLGVIVGIIDSGINILHPVFRLPNDQTKTRIRAILDQTQTPSVTYRRLQIQAAIPAT